MKQKLFSLLLLLAGMVQETVAQKEAYVASDDYGNTVTFYYDDQKSSRSWVAEINKSYTDYWNPDQYPPHPYHNVSEVTFDASFADYRPTSTAYWFCGCYYLRSFSGLENLNTSEVTDMSYMFDGCSSMSRLDFSKFNTANVKNMYHMFYGSDYMKELDLSSFNTAKVTDMGEMFSGCTSLERIYVDGAKWSTANVTNGSNMFKDCLLLIGENGTTYDESCADYDYARIDKSGAPGYFTSFDAPRPYATLSLDYENEIATLTLYCDDKQASRSDVVEYYSPEFFEAKVWVDKIVFDASFADYQLTNTAGMFRDCTRLTSIAGLENLNTSKVRNMSGMFSRCTSLQVLDLSSFNTEKVTNMSGMFRCCSSLTSINLSSFNTVNVTSMAYMFNECYSLTSLDLSNFNTANVISLDEMFNWCPALTNLNISNFNTTNVPSMKRMFYNCQNLTTLDLSSFNTENVTDMSEMFCRCSSLTTIYADEEKWKTDKMYYIGDDWQGYGGFHMFRSCTNLVGGNGTQYDSNHIDAEYARIDKEGQPGYLTQKSASGIMSIEQCPLTIDHYYTLDGRRMEGLPTQKGLYIINGKKVVVK